METHLSVGGSKVGVEAENEATGVTEGISHGMGGVGMECQRPSKQRSSHG